MEAPPPSQLPWPNDYFTSAKALRKLHPAPRHRIKHQTVPTSFISYKAVMASKGSKSAIPVFLFLGIVLVFLPVTALICVWIQGRRQSQRSDQSRAETAERVAENLHRWSKTAPIEMGNVQRPPPAAVQPIRGMSSGKRPQYLHRALSQHDTPLDKPRGPTTESTAHSSSTVIENSIYPFYPDSTPSNPFTAPAPPSPRYDLQAALGSEPSPASVHTGSERRANLADAPRVKSLKVSPQETAEAYHGVERPDVPEFEDAYFAERQHPARWV